MRRPRVATLAARSSLPCCCTSEGSDVIRVFIREVKHASRLGRKGGEHGEGRGWGLTEQDQALRKPKSPGSQLHQARIWQIRQQGGELILGPTHGIWGEETGLTGTGRHVQKGSKDGDGSVCPVPLSF